MPVTVGTWEGQGDAIVLHAEAAELGSLRSRTLQRVQEGGCTYLRESGHEDEPASMDYMAFRVAGEHCNPQD